MVKVANANAREQGMLDVSFREADATSLKDFSDNHFDLTTMMDAAHHLSPPRGEEQLDPPTKLVTAALNEMDRVTSPGGLIVVMDLVRLRTKSITETYIELLAHDYVKRGLPAFKEDFRDSMYAAWTSSELRSAVPMQSKRRWNLVVPRGLPFAQFLIGFPRERRSPFINQGRMWNDVNRVPVNSENMPDYRMARLMMLTAANNSIE
jgi:SAM-dependent methyltransferase